MSPWYSGWWAYDPWSTSGNLPPMSTTATWGANCGPPIYQEPALPSLSRRALARWHLMRFTGHPVEPSRPEPAQSLRRVVHRAPREPRLRPGMRRLIRA